MTSLRALSVAAVLAAASFAHAESPASSSAGYVDVNAFRALIDENAEVVEVNLEGAILQAMANSKDGDDPGSKDLFSKLKAIHAVIGTVKGPASEALALVKKTDEKLAAAGWQRIARIKDESSTVSVLTHTTGEKIDGLVALIFDTDDKEIVFANLAGEIDLNRIGEIGEKLHVPGLNGVPGLH
ncbi:MAG TPA: DUF4252 domain-containing protein [Candidatus Polarisedimenticolaceae bacterium]|nr:DUF4252 domain-containing protein [Candidatus Polarisedimenticolaceae bacterium]